jgi:hypothetical protein
MPAVERTAPTASKSLAGARRLSLSRRRTAPASTTAHTGRLTKKTQRQPGPWVSSPEARNAGHGGERDRRAAETDRLRAALPFRERGGQDRQRGRGHHRRPETLRQPCPDQDGFARRQTAEEGGDPERERPGDEQPPPKQVGCAARLVSLPADRGELRALRLGRQRGRGRVLRPCGRLQHPSATLRLTLRLGGAGAGTNSTACA